MLSPGSRLGKYQIERPLGRGGMGAVFLATDTVLRRPVAIKVLVSEADSTDRSPARLLREARSASALNHPNIVGVYEIGEENAVAFISMEYVQGRPLSEIVEGGSLTVEQSIRYAIEAADALAHAHDRGVVHSDLKAANAILSSSGRIKLVDFGIAGRLHQVASDATVTSTATEERTPAGTPYAMAPEQVRGIQVDARTDVWALGVLLYEMLSGARPFVAPTVPELFSAILRDAPAPLTAHVPAALRAIVQKCLEKDPAQRYERAADVRLALEVVASGNESLASQGPHPVAKTGAPLPPPPFVSALPDTTAFVGRDAEIAQMTRAWDQARSGRRHLLLLAGEPGIGKTRLATEFARQCAAQQATVLAGRSDEEALVPYQPFAEALTWYARVCPEPELRSTLNAIGGGAELAPIVVELMRRIPDLRTSLKSGGEGERYRLFDVIDALFAAASSVHPIVLVLDDLHWADQPTLLLLKHLLRSTRTAALSIVGTYRDSELRRTHPLAEILADFRRDKSVTRLSLRGLTATDVQGLAPSIAGHSVPSGLAALVVEGAGGNPFFIGEILRHLRETDAFSDVNHDVDLGLPEGVKEVIGRRLSRLSEECNRALALAAVIGREFDVELLIALGDLPEDRLLDAIDEAVRAQLIAEVVGGRSRLTFRHALIRETLYGELLSVRRVRLHRRVAEAIEEKARGRANPPLADLAYHFSQSASAGTAVKALEYAARAGDRASELLAYEEAARMYDLALQSIEFADGPNLVARRVDLHIRRARAFGSLGQWAAEKDDALRALELLEPQDLERRAELVLMVADASFYLLDNPSVDRYASEALDLARKVNRTDLAADAMGWIGRSLQASGDLAGAIEMDKRAISLGKPRRGVALMHGPLTLYLAGRSHEAAEQGRQAAETARTAKDTELTMYALTHYGLSLGAIGRYRDAASTFEEARQFGRKYGVLPPLARATSMSGGFHLSVFDLDGAETIHTDARELARSLNFMPTIVSSGIDLLFVHVRRNDVGRAQVLLPEVESAAAATPGWHDWLWRGRLKQVRAELALACGDASTAFDCAQRAIEYWRENGRIKYEALGHISAARALRALGRTREAIAHARDALAIARPTSDPALVLWALNVLLALDGDDALAREARTVSDAIRLELPDDAMQRRFAESELVQTIPGR
jgi:tetratricopeptide (TPR) repeat protein/predicted Ser/Thr protein kinase